MPQGLAPLRPVRRNRVAARHVGFAVDVWERRTHPDPEKPIQQAGRQDRSWFRLRGVMGRVGGTGG